MTDGTCPPVSVSRQINAPAATLFGLLVDPSSHPGFDGSGMLRQGAGPDLVSAVGDVFAVTMHNDEMGHYEMANHVVEFERDRRIAWEPVLSRATRAEDMADVGQRAGHRWGYVLAPIGLTSTVVTEYFDCAAAPEQLRRAVDGGRRWLEAMATSLERLDALATEP